jgi:protein-S-isoprenylcysteine O-methyltransferase Ste14
LQDTEEDPDVTPDAGTLEPAGATRGAAVKVVAAWIVLPLFFLATGGSIRWWQAWVYCAMLLGPMTLFIAYMARHDPEFIARRTKLRENDPAERRILAWGYPSLVAALVIPGLDRRFGWSEPSLAVVVAAQAAVLAGYLAVLRVFLENRWAGRTIETYANQQVISTGPYAIVRHPMYAGTIVLYVATPLALGSWWAVLPAVAFIPIFVLRIRHEEEVLLRELRGYGAYRQQVRYRLVPRVW